MDNPAWHHNMSDMESDAIIIGGGLNGSTMALALASAGLSVTIIDPLPQNTRADAAFDGRGYALAHASKRLLSALDIWPQVADKAQEILDIKVSDGRPGEGASPMVLEFDHAEIEEGPMGYMLEDRHLRRALLGAMQQNPNITQITEKVASHSTEGATASVQLSNGNILTTRLIIAADGAQSPTAKRAKITRTGWDYGQTALVCAIAHKRPHHGTAHQFFMPPGPLAILPLPNMHASIVWTERSEEAARIQALDDAGYITHLAPRVGDFLGPISLAGSRFTYPLGLSIANRFAEHRLALIGDAAHKVHPIAGQGLNAGLKDVAALAETIVAAHRRGEDFGRSDVLNRYQEWRRFDTASLALATDGFNRLFSNDNPALRLARDIGLAAVNAWPGLRRSLIREAAGLTGDLPRLLQGHPL